MKSLIKGKQSSRIMVSRIVHTPGVSSAFVSRLLISEMQEFVRELDSTRSDMATTVWCPIP
jgi:hypothetical protein